MAARRIANQPAYVLHRYPWSESSLILELFTRQHGRVALVAKGAKRPTSNFRPVLLPLQPIRVTWSVSGASDAEIHALKGAEWQGGHVMPTGDALLAGTYCNELLLKLLARDDAHPRLFDAYAGAVAILVSAHGEALEPVLRTFELLLLRDIGLLPALDAETATLRPVAAAGRYVLVPETGLREAHQHDRAHLDGAAWHRIEAALSAGGPFTDTLRAVAAAAGELKTQLRALLQYHVGHQPLRTRQLMVDLQNL